MILFVDTANFDEIKEAATWGFVKGVTTNPSLIAKENLTQKEIITKITKLIDGPISAEVTVEGYDNMVKQAQELFKIDPNHIVIKLPMTIDGLQTCKKLHTLKIPTNVTLCFSESQALIAMENYATYLSPFLGRLDDVGVNSFDLIENIMKIKHNYNYDTKIICASIRNHYQVSKCAMLGADIATVPFKILKSLVKHHLTDAGLATFDEAIKKTAQITKK